MATPPSGTPTSHGRAVRAFLAISASFAVLVAVASAYGYVLFSAAQSDVPHFQTVPLAGDSGSISAPDFGPCVDNVCNYLILGSDSREGLPHDQLVANGTDAQIGGENRSDTIMLVHTEPDQGKATILSFPRDLWVDIPGHGYDKINSAFEGGLDGGGPQLVSRTIEKLTGLHINHVLYVNLAGFEGIVDALGGVYLCIPTAMTDPLTQLDVKAGCQTLDAQQALGYVRTRHQPCDYIPDFSRIGRQQQFLRAVLNEILSPSAVLQAPSLVRPVAKNLVTDDGFKLADIVYLVKQLQGITNGTADFRSVPGTPGTVIPPGYTTGLSVVQIDPAATRIFAAIRAGRPIGDIGTELDQTPPSEANIAVPVVDHDSAGKALEVADVLSASGFDITPGVVSYASLAGMKGVKGNVIAYAPGNDLEAQVVAKYFPDLKMVQVAKNALGGPSVGVVVTASYQPADLGGSTPTCIVP